MIKRLLYALPIIISLCFFQPVLAQEKPDDPLLEDPVWLDIIFTGRVLNSFGLNYDLPFNDFDPIEGNLVVQGVLAVCDQLEDNATFVLTFSEPPRITIKNLINGAEFNMTNYPMWKNAAIIPGILTVNYVKDLGRGEQFTLNWSYQYLPMGAPGNEFCAGAASFSPDVIPGDSNLEDSVGDSWGRITENIITSPQRTLQVSVDPDWGYKGGLLAAIRPEINPCVLEEPE